MSLRRLVGVFPWDFQVGSQTVLNTAIMLSHCLVDRTRLPYQTEVGAKAQVARMHKEERVC